MDELSVKAMALGVGVCWSAAMALLGIASVFGWGRQMTELFGCVYRGFKPTFSGMLIGALWGFADGAIAGAVIALIYNFFI